jgi:hypothetical protein
MDRLLRATISFFFWRYAVQSSAFARSGGAGRALAFLVATEALR